VAGCCGSNARPAGGRCGSPMSSATARCSSCACGVTGSISPAVFTLEHEMLPSGSWTSTASRSPTYTLVRRAPAIVMDRVGGWPDFGAVTADQRDTVMDDYMSILARMHALDVNRCPAGLTRAETPARSVSSEWTATNGSTGAPRSRPDPFLEFCLAWLRRHPLANPGRGGGDRVGLGQFPHDGGRILALLDLESPTSVTP